MHRARNQAHEGVRHHAGIPHPEDRHQRDDAVGADGHGQHRGRSTPGIEVELEDLRSVLSKADPRVPANWSRRFKNHQEKLKSGDVYQVAEVVRNLAARDRDSALSAAEKTMYDRARINLISEISPALKVSTEAAEVWLDNALEQGVLKPAKAAKAKAAPKPAEKAAEKPAAKAPAKKAAKPAKAAAKKK